MPSFSTATPLPGLLEENQTEAPSAPDPAALVENAATHAIARILEGGTVRVEAVRRGPQVRLTVENPNDPDAADRKGAGTGSRDVRRRLAATYGEEATLDIDDGEESFRVELRFPCSDRGAS